MPPRRSRAIRRLFPASEGEPNIARRAAWLALAYLAVTGSLLAFLLLQLRTETVVASERELSALAQLTAGHTSEVVLGIEESLRVVEATLSVATDTGAADQDSIRAMLVDVIGAARGLRHIFVLDTQGRVVYSARGDGEVGDDRSSRPYFVQFRDNPNLKFDIGVPLQRTTQAGRGEWFIPAVHSWRRANGEFAGVIVGIIDPKFFDTAWTFDTEIAGISIGLAGQNGTLIMRRPFDAAMIGRSMGNGVTAAQLASSPAAVSLRVLNTVDGQFRLLAYRRIAAYPRLYSFVAQPVSEVLASWWRIAWIGGASWLLASLALGGLGAWLAHVIKVRAIHENRYHALFDSIPYPVIVSDLATQRILALNEAATQQYGWSRKEVFARMMTTADVYSPRDPAERADARATDGAQAALAQQQHHKKDGTMIDVETIVRRIDYDSRPAELTIAVDVSDRLRLERARQTAEEQLRRVQKMDVLGELTGGIAHDFNNILTVIMNNTDALLEEGDAGPETSERLRSIADSTRRAEDLTRQMLAFSRKQPLRPRPTNINDLVVDTGKLLRRTLGAHIEIDSVLKDDLWAVEIDRSQLETALVKLCLNARDAMPTGGRLLIETENAIVGKEDVGPESTAPPGAYVLLTVSDLGSGIATNDLDKVFEPFFATKEDGKGFGLSMVYGFVKQSNGYIGVQSELGQGTSFKLYLPRYEGTVEETPIARKPALLGGFERLLVVEDDNLVRASVIRQLKSLGYSVSEAADGAAGVAAFEAAPQPFDLLLTDVVMPGPLNGKDLADEVARRWPSTRTVFMSGYTDNLLTRDGRLDTGVRLLSKPFRKSDLASIIRQALDGDGAKALA